MPFSMRSALATLIGGGTLLAAMSGEAAFVPRQASPPRLARALVPPPASPWDGYAHAHRSGALLHFDSDLGVYTVSGAADLYYFGNAFIRRRSGLWEFSPRPSGPWAAGRAEWVPVRLRAAHYREAGESGRGARGAPKNGW
jgi:hypothetical protein